MSEQGRSVTIKKIGTVTVQNVFNGGKNGGIKYLEKLGVEEVDSVDHQKDWVMKTGLNEEEFAKVAEM